MDIGSLVLLGGGIVLAALLGGRVGVAVGAGAGYGLRERDGAGAEASAGHPDPLDGDTLRVFHGG